MLSIKNYLSNHRFFYFFIGLCWLLFFFSPYFILQKDAPMPISDNWMVLTNYKIIGNEKYFFADNNLNIPNQMLGVPRVSYPSEFYYISIIFYILGQNIDYFWFLTLNAFFIHLIGFIGMWLLLDYITPFFLKQLNLKLDEKIQFLIFFIVSSYFACSPHWAIGGLSTTGQPLILYSFLKILNKQSNYKHWLIIILYPFFSGFYFSNLYFIPVLFFIALVHSLIYKKFNLKPYLAIISLIIFSVVAEYRLFEYIIHPNFESMRLENKTIQTTISFISFIKETFLCIILALKKNPTIFFISFYGDINRWDNFIVFFLYLILIPILYKNKNNIKVYLVALTITFLIIFPTHGNVLFLKTLLSKLFPSYEKIFYSMSTRYIANVTQVLWCLMLFHFLILLSRFMNYKILTLTGIFFLIINIYKFNLFSDNSNNPIVHFFEKDKFSANQYNDKTLFSNINNYFKSKNINLDSFKIFITGTYETSIKGWQTPFYDMIFSLNNFHTIGGYIPFYPKQNFLKLNKLKSKIDSLSAKLNYSHKQHTDPRIMTYFLPKFNDTLYINQDIINYSMDSLDAKYIVTNYPLNTKSTNLKLYCQFKGDYKNAYFYMKK